MADLIPLRVLVIDDNRQMRTIVGSVLNAAGVGHLNYAADGRRGLEAIAEYPIDVVYVDYEMPVMNGLDFISSVRRLDSPARYMPIIMLTGHSDVVRLDGARDRGVTEFLCKPVTAKAILSRLNAVIMQPRAFVESETYFGPDRRRSRRQAPGGLKRRAADVEGVLQL
jgi:two-component system chemotaxis response regulator CheY